LRPSCAQIYPSPKILGDGIEAKSCRDSGATKRNSALRKTSEKFSAQVRLSNAEENSK
jgi:hypothetical protein